VPLPPPPTPTLTPFPSSSLSSKCGQITEQGKVQNANLTGGGRTDGRKERGQQSCNIEAGRVKN
jgi:hypothetical protein